MRVVSSVVCFCGKPDLIHVKDFRHGCVGDLLVKLDDVVAVFARRGGCDMAVEVGDVAGLVVVIGKTHAQTGMIFQVITTVL